MQETGSSFAVKAIAALVLLVAAWILLKVVIGAVLALTWTVVGILAVVAVIWALVTLAR